MGIIARPDSMFLCKRYWHGNEPCHQVAYLYAWSSHPEKTAAVVTDILDTEYRNTPGGLSGNDDAGQMSAWYVFSCLGFYPVCPGSGEYALGVPAFERILVHQENGRDFEIVKGEPVDGKASLDGRELKRPFLKHRSIVRGGKLEF
ncbi:MAG: glycoside hydrolase family 92 protein [Bacteroidales bacterium]|nr:glycoside hydrolase family 92 protein [Bacteroidales bacterium]